MISLSDFKNPLSFGLFYETLKTSVLYTIVGYKNTQDVIQPAHCQRELCWSLEQYKSYIKNCLETRICGNFIIYEDSDGDKVYLIDGQHRVHAWKMFISGELTLSHDGQEITYSDFTRGDQSSIERMTGLLTRIIGKGYPAEAIEQVYNKFNFSGVKHKKEQQA